ncbi:MAG: HD domain-containing protein [Planctomycetota bacterium]|nr:HD domain-containing protein [Planctomycetota bacterium]
MTIESLIEEIISNLDKYNLDDCLQDIGENILHYMNAERCLFFLLEPGNEDLSFAKAVGDEPAMADVVRIPMGSGIVGEVAEECSPIVIPDVKDPSCKKKFADFGKMTPEIDEKTKSVLALPLVVFGSLIGVLEIQNLPAEMCTRASIRKLLPLVNIAAVSIPRRATDDSFVKLAEIAVRFLEEKDEYTHGHSLRVMRYSMMLADKINLPIKEKNELRICSLLHDIGKVIIKDSILRKKGKLTESEFETIKMHCRIGANICSKISRPLARKILSHHERWDGKGYPEGLGENRIPLVSRIIAIADSFDAMTSARPYREKMQPHEALEELKRNAGTQFDPHLVEAFVVLYNEGLLDVVKV